MTNNQLTGFGIACALLAAVGSYAIDEPHAGGCFLIAAAAVWLFNREA